jgi:hypothetical protein
MIKGKIGELDVKSYSLDVKSYGLEVRRYGLWGLGASVAARLVQRHAGLRLACMRIFGLGLSATMRSFGLGSRV